MTHATCPRCGGRLARDNDTGRCTPCQAAERDRLSTPPVVPANFWDHEPVRLALAERHLGRVIRAYRCHPYHGRVALPQSVVAGWLGITQAQLSRVENGPPVVHLDRLAHWANLLGIPASCLWFGLPGQPYRVDDRAAEGTADDPYAHGAITEQGKLPAMVVTVEGASTGGGGATDRRRFNAMAALAGLAAAGHPYLMTDPAEVPRNIGMEQVRLASSLVQDFRRADAAAGAVQLCDIAVQAHARLSNWAARAHYSREVGDALQSALAELGIQVAWLAIDAERRPEARPYLNEAITRARIADDPRMEVQALTQLSMLLRESQPGESLHCAEAALRVSARWATPRLTTLLHLRRAHTYAVLTDAGGFSREMTKARRELERGPHEDDLAFVSFVNEQEVNGIQGLSYLALERPDRAAQSFRALIANPSPGHRRNQVLYTIDLADAAYQQGDTNEAARIALDVLPAVRQMNSGRVSRNLAQVRAKLAALRDATATTREFVDAYDRAVTV
ncbi:helix-turn-helix domain-containing protein [Micromonospora sp. NPDC051543]|uniref:helix-turn-helix domain-containing protein n=1 Tax=Micromonospora sp. NPDC051543 TaxID=3364287 RepID=UPI0037930FC8